MLRIIDTAQHCSRSHDAVIRVYDDTGNVIAAQEHAGNFVEPLQLTGCSELFAARVC